MHANRLQLASIGQELVVAARCSPDAEVTATSDGIQRCVCRCSAGDFRWEVCIKVSRADQAGSTVGLASIVAQFQKCTLKSRPSATRPPRHLCCKHSLTLRPSRLPSCREGLCRRPGISCNRERAPARHDVREINSSHSQALRYGSLPSEGNRLSRTEPVKQDHPARMAVTNPVEERQDELPKVDAARSSGSTHAR